MSHCPGIHSSNAGRAHACKSCPNSTYCQASSGTDDSHIRERIRTNMHGKKIVVVMGGKGGVGKSTVCMLLMRMARPCCLLDFDMSGPSIAKMSRTEDAVVTGVDRPFVPVDAGDGNGVISYYHVMDVVNDVDRQADADVDIDRNDQTDVERMNVDVDRNDQTDMDKDKNDRMTNQYDSRAVSAFLINVLMHCDLSAYQHIVIDTPPGISEEHLIISNYLGSTDMSALLVTTPSTLAHADLLRQIDFCRKTAIRVAGIVENMKEFVCECMHVVPLGDVDVKKECDRMGIRYVGGVRCRKEIGYDGDRGVVNEGLFGDVGMAMIRALGISPDTD